MNCARWIVSAALAAGAFPCIPVRGQEVAAIQAVKAKLAGVVDDWTTHHVAFSNPGTREYAMKKGTLDRWTKVTNDPRYQMQQLKRAAASQPTFNAGPDAADRIGVLRKPSGNPRIGFHHYLVPNTITIIKDWSQDLGGGPTIPGTVEPNAYPAKFGISDSSLGTASCSDFVVYPTGQPGSATAATIIAFTNLYSSCSGDVPTVAWAYNTGTGYAVTTAPTLSADGTEVIFVQSNGTSSQLVALAWAASTTETVSSPGSPMNVSNVNGCTTACMATTALTSLDSISAAYYVYDADAVFVGTDSGTIDKITPILNAAIGTASSVTLPGAGDVASPVYDGTSGCVFVGDSNGFVYSVDSGLPVGSVCNSGAFKLYGHSDQLASAGGGGIYDAPLFDAGTGTFYVFVSRSNGSICTTTDANCVAEFQASTIGSGSTSALPIDTDPLGGPNTVANPIYQGNTYYSSTGGTGNLYVVGGTGDSSAAMLFQIPITSAAISSSASVSVSGLTGGTEYPWPSPATEFYNANDAKDYLFFSVNDGAPSGCTNSAGNGCILSYNITTTSVSLEGTGQNFITPGTDGCWSTGGIVIDNDAATAGASQIYFVNLNGEDAGTLDPDGNVVSASSNCTAGTNATLQAVQAAQAAP